MTDDGHEVRQLWVRPRAGGPMQARDVLDLVTGQGVTGDHTLGRMRHVTIVFEDDWNAASAQLGRTVAPSGRRANVLVSGGQGGRWIGRSVRLGDAVLEIKGETKPCPVMDQAAVGMREALVPHQRAGIWGRVIDGGAVRPGDTLGAADD